MKIHKFITILGIISVIVIFIFIANSISEKQNTTIFNNDTNISERDKNSQQPQSIVDEVRAKIDKNKTKNKSEPSTNTNNNFEQPKSNLNDTGHIKPFEKSGLGIDKEFELDSGEINNGSELNTDVSSQMDN